MRLRHIALPPLLRFATAAWLILLCMGSAGLAAGPDLGVRFISRAPLYWRYNVQYSGNVPYLAPTHDGQDPLLDKHWPDPAERVTFTAHIRNHGDAPVTDFQYRWLIDGVPRGGLKTYRGTIDPDEEVTVSISGHWPPNLNDHTITIELDPNLLTLDLYRQNNTYTDHTNALSFSIWVEQGLYDLFKTRLNGFGTMNFDDWFRWQFETMQDDFARSIYPDIAPSGILERIRIEEINVIPFDPGNLNNFHSYLDNDPHVFLNDGRWQFVWDASTLSQKQSFWQGYLDAEVQQIDWGLIHELAHQLGVIDEYRMNLPGPEWNEVTRLDGSRLDSTHLFSHGGLMGGGYVLDGYDGSYFDSHTAGYLNRNLHQRRGYYGEFLFDVPQTCLARFTDITGNPLGLADVSFYQKDQYVENIPDTPVFTGRTDALGQLTMPDRPVIPVTTATGHTLHDNPFGQINVVGTNGTMLVKVVKDRQEDYRWLEIIQLNEAFWRGDTQSATIDFQTDIIPLDNRAAVGSSDHALGMPATASSNAFEASFANDGDTIDPARYWDPNPTSAGQWWQVDLGHQQYVARVTIYGFAGNWHDWYSQFHLEVSATGAFSGEQAVIPLETQWDVSRSCGDYSLQRLTGLQDHVAYTFIPVRGQYVRVVGDVDQPWVKLQEVQVNGLVR